MHRTFDACASRKYHKGPITLHDLILGQSTSVLGTLHGIAVAHIGVLDIGQAKGPATVLVTSELGCVHVSK